MASTRVDPKPVPVPKRRVLVVDHHLDTVHSLAVLIRMLGHEVEFAINGIAAIDVARGFRPEIIFMDLNLPDIKGGQLARQLKFERGLEGVRIFAFSGISSDEVRKRVLAAGCEDLFVKPVEPSRLEALLTMGPPAVP